MFAGVRKAADGERIRQSASVRLTALLLDVTDAEQIAAAAAAIRSDVGPAGFFGLVNNAGIAVAGPLELVPLDDFRRQLEVNVIGQVAVLQAVLPLIRAAQGRIVNMSSISGRVAPPYLGPYAASNTPWRRSATAYVPRCGLFASRFPSSSRPASRRPSGAKPGLAWIELPSRPPRSDWPFIEKNSRPCRRSQETLTARAMPVQRVVPQWSTR